MPDGEVEINGGIVVYEWVGPQDGEVVVLTPGGRFSKDAGGIHELANKLAEGGKRVFLWDRPNCGRSDVQFFGRSESHMRAETLGTVLQKLGVEQVVAAGGSGGARDMIVFSMMYPDLVRKLLTWCIVGGTFSSMQLAGAYIFKELRAVRSGGIEAVMEINEGAFGWKAMIEANPRNKERFLAIGAEEFERIMVRWLEAYVPKSTEAIPGVPDHEFDDLHVPTLIVRGGAKDYDHPPRTSFEIHALIKGSRLIEPPWPEDAWEAAGLRTAAGTGAIFDFWQDGAPAFLAFIDE